MNQIDEIFIVKIGASMSYDYTLCFAKKSDAETYLKENGFTSTLETSERMGGSFDDIHLRRTEYFYLGRYYNAVTEEKAWIESLCFLGKR